MNNSSSENIVGIDIGGTKVSVCLGKVDGTILAHKRIETALLKGPDVGLPKIAELISALLEEEKTPLKDINAVGLAAPGPVSTKVGTLLTPPNLPLWVDVPIVRYLEAKLGLPVFMDNDANAGALAEWEFGSAKHVDNLVYLTMSTGMGGGLVIQKKIHQGGTDTGGEVGHFILDPKGPQCPCGLQGCFEAYCGGQSLANRVKEEVSKGVQTILANDVESIDMKVIIEAVKQKDRFALSVWEEYIERLSQGIGILIQTLNPEAIILGTVATHNQDLVMPPLKKALCRYAWKIPLDYCRIEPSALKGEIGMLGALALAIQGLNSGEIDPQK
ncbi:MAG: ROK family protein [Simkaniaceae bacterium]|nr:ROK family protein [Simkaniaceae bacterium]